MPVNVDTKEIRLSNGTLIVKDDSNNDVELGLLTDVKFTADKEVAYIEADNGKVWPFEKYTKATISANLKNFNIEKLKLLAGGNMTIVDAASSPTGNERKVLTIDGAIRALSGREVLFKTTDSNGKEWWVKLFNAYASKGLDLDLPSSYKIDDVTSLSIEFTAEGDGNIFEIYDEQYN